MFTVEIGPNTIADTSDPSLGINLASRLYGEFEKQIPTNFVYFERKDVEWAQSKVNKFLEALFKTGRKEKQARCVQVKFSVAGQVL